MTKINQQQAKSELEKQAKKVGKKDLSKLLDKQKSILDKILKNDTIKKYLGKVKLMFLLLRDYKNGSYRTIPWKSVAAISGALLYVLNPFDLVPDFLPVLGLMDDASVIAACLKLIDDDLEKYKVWKNSSSASKNELEPL